MPDLRDHDSKGNPLVRRPDEPLDHIHREAQHAWLDEREPPELPTPDEYDRD